MFAGLSIKRVHLTLYAHCDPSPTKEGSWKGLGRVRLRRWAELLVVAGGSID